MITEIKKSVKIPVMAKVRIGHFVEAQILEALEIDYIDESEVLTPADPELHVDKTEFKIPFVCGAKNLGEALRRIEEGASMIRTKGEAGTGNIVEAVRHMRTIQKQIQEVLVLRSEELVNYAKIMGVSVELLRSIQKSKKLPVVNFSAGGVATPADAALMMQLGADGVFVGSGIFKSQNPQKMAKAIVEAVAYFNDPKKLAAISNGLGSSMRGDEIETLSVKMQERGI